MRVLFLADVDAQRSPSARQWFYKMHKLLAERGFETSLNAFDYSEYDVVIILWVRPDLIQRALDHSPKAHIGILNTGYLGFPLKYVRTPEPASTLASIRQVVDNVDFFIGTTFMWRDLVLPYQRRVYLVIDYDEPEGKPIKQHTGTTDLVIGYHGNELHYAHNFFPHGANALKRLACEHNFTLKIITSDAGSQPRIDGVKTEFVEFDLESFADEIQTFDIGICPVFSDMAQLADPFIYMRNSNRVHTLLFYGIPSVTSPIPQACHDLVEGETALFAVSEEGWYDALKRLISQPALRNHIGRTGREMVASRFSTEQGVKAFVDMLNEEIKMPLVTKKEWKTLPRLEQSHFASPIKRLCWQLRSRLLELR
ncbi:MAG: glycosyltransferase [Thermoflexales bacterium]|nr:glycosyltransferase [Thermoflexales bacterium]